MKPRVQSTQEVSNLMTLQASFANSIKGMESFQREDKNTKPLVCLHTWFCVLPPGCFLYKVYLFQECGCFILYTRFIKLCEVMT